MLSTPEYAFRKRKKVTTVFRDQKIVWVNREEAKDYILELMISAEVEDYDRCSAHLSSNHSWYELLHRLKQTEQRVLLSCKALCFYVTYKNSSEVSPSCQKYKIYILIMLSAQSSHWLITVATALSIPSGG